MADKIQCAFDTAAANLYAIVRNSGGQAWNGSSFENYTTANLGNYDIALTEQGTASRYYTADFPTVAAGIYAVTIYERAGGSPAEGDTAITGGSIDWDGSVIVPLYTRLAPTTAGRTLTVSAAGAADAHLTDIAHGGTAATLTLERIIVASTTSGEPAMKLTGNTTGAGLAIAAGSTGAGLTITTTAGHGVNISPSGTDKHGIFVTGGNGGTCDGIHAIAGTGGVGLRADKLTIDGNTTFTGTTTYTGSVTMSAGLQVLQSASNSIALQVTGNGTGAAMRLSGGAGGGAALIAAGGSSSAAIQVTNSGGDGISIAPTNGHGILVTANGNNRHGMVVTGGTAGTADGLKLVAGTGGVGFRIDTMTVSGALTANNASNDVQVILQDGKAHGGTLGSSTATLAFNKVSLVNNSADGNAVRVENTISAESSFVISTNVTDAIALEISSGSAAAVSLYGNGEGWGALDIAGSTGAWPVSLYASGGDADGINIAAAGTGKHDIALSGSGTFWNTVDDEPVTVTSTVDVSGVATEVTAAAIKAKTDQLTFTVANTVNANITHVTGDEVTGSGTTGDEWGPA